MWGRQGMGQVFGSRTNKFICYQKCNGKAIKSFKQRSTMLLQDNKQEDWKGSSLVMVQKRPNSDSDYRDREVGVRNGFYLRWADGLFRDHVNFEMPRNVGRQSSTCILFWEGRFGWSYKFGCGSHIVINWLEERQGPGKMSVDECITGAYEVQLGDVFTV